MFVIRGDLVYIAVSDGRSIAFVDDANSARSNCDSQILRGGGVELLGLYLAGQSIAGSVWLCGPFALVLLLHVIAVFGVVCFHPNVHRQHFMSVGCFVFSQVSVLVAGVCGSDGVGCLWDVFLHRVCGRIERLTVRSLVSEYVEPNEVG